MGWHPPLPFASMPPPSLLRGKGYAGRACEQDGSGWGGGWGAHCAPLPEECASPLEPRPKCRCGTPSPQQGRFAPFNLIEGNGRLGQRSSCRVEEREGLSFCLPTRELCLLPPQSMDKRWERAGFEALPLPTPTPTELGGTVYRQIFLHICRHSVGLCVGGGGSTQKTKPEELFSWFGKHIWRL